LELPFKKTKWLNKITEKKLWQLVDFQFVQKLKQKDVLPQPKLGHWQQKKKKQTAW
jgi:hypothetical protein